jgi:hypothetical protein
LGGGYAATTLIGWMKKILAKDALIDNVLDIFYRFFFFVFFFFFPSFAFFLF